MQNEQTKTQIQHPAEAVAERTTSKLPAVLALVFGVFVVMGAGFAHSNTIHNAAHDARHAFGFPCH